ncbi:MAG: efflux RND transporter periplasmic adaptor subunit [Candidatus Binatia bacterium]
MRHAILGGALALLALGAGCEGGSRAGDAPGAGRSDAVPITVAPVAVRTVERAVSVVGTLLANEEAEVASEVEGQVASIEADLGDRVGRDQVLARVRGDVTEAKLREAEAAFEKATADEARARPLRGQGVISPQEYDQVRSQLDGARARRDQLRIQLDRTAIRAPFDGSVAARLVSAGDYVRTGSVILRLVQDRPLKFRAEVPEREAPALQPGQEVRIGVDAFRGETFLGHVSRVAAASDTHARSLAFEAVVPNEDGRLRPGFFGHADVVISHDERALAVPRSALSTFAGVTKLFSIEDGVAHEREVALGVDLGDGWVEVTQGVTRGMQIATSGISRLTEGARVAVRADVPPGA